MTETTCRKCKCNTSNRNTTTQRNTSHRRLRCSASAGHGADGLQATRTYNVHNIMKCAAAQVMLTSHAMLHIHIMMHAAAYKMRKHKTHNTHTHIEVRCSAHDAQHKTQMMTRQCQVQLLLLTPLRLLPLLLRLLMPLRPFLLRPPTQLAYHNCQYHLYG
jgi:hypothetical protein